MGQGYERVTAGVAVPLVALMAMTWDLLGNRKIRLRAGV
jgi:hypothetical protein